MKTLLSAVTLLALTANPALAATPTTATPAKALSLTSHPRAGAPAARSDKLAAKGGTVTVVLIAAAVVGALVLITNTESDDSDSN